MEKSEAGKGDAGARGEFTDLQRQDLDVNISQWELLSTKLKDSEFDLLVPRQMAVVRHVFWGTQTAVITNSTQIFSFLFRLAKDDW